MSLARFQARQLSRPSGIWGRVVLPRLFNWRNAALNAAVLQALDLRPDDRVLEVGFGGGHLLRRMSERVTAGLLAGADISPEMAAFCRQRYRTLVEAGRLVLACASAESLPYAGARFTKACTVNTIFYVPDAGRAMVELCRVLADGGSAVVCFTVKASLQDRSFSRQGLTLFDEADVRRLMERAGFRDIRAIPGEDRWRRFVCVIGRK